MNREILPPPNSQRTDPHFRYVNKNGSVVDIRPNAQCKGNCTEDLLISIGKEFSVPELANASGTTQFYAIIVGAILTKSPGKIITARDLFTNANHMLAIDHVLSGHKNLSGLRAYWRDIRPSPALMLSQNLERTKRPLMTLGYPTGASGHWIVLYSPATKDGVRGFNGNDSFGTYPYRTETEKNTVSVFYSEDFINKMKFRSCIGIEEK